MTVKELIERLSTLQADAEVVIGCEHEGDLRFAHRFGNVYEDRSTAKEFVVISPSYSQLLDDEPVTYDDDDWEDED